MDFALLPEQEAVARSVRALAERHRAAAALARVHHDGFPATRPGNDAASRLEWQRLGDRTKASSRNGNKSLQDVAVVSFESFLPAKTVNLDILLRHRPL